MLNLMNSTLQSEATLLQSKARIITNYRSFALLQCGVRAIAR